MLVTLAGMVTVVRPVSSKAPFSIVVSFEPAAKETDVRLLHFINTLSPMLVTLAGMVTEVRPDASKAYFPIVVTLAGMVIEVRLLHFLKR